jgi:hypothetical protein
MPRKKSAVFYVGQRPHLHIPKKTSPEIKQLAKAMVDGNVEAVAAIIYMTDGDVWRIHDIGRLEAHEIRADLIELAGRVA